MIIKPLLTSLLVAATLSFSPGARTEPCSCEEGFEELADKVEKNYIGLALMRARGEAGNFDDLRREFSDKASAVPPERCTALYQEFLNHFDDDHLFAFERPTYPDDQLRRFQEKVQARGRSVDAVIATLKQQEKGSDAIVGRWYDGHSEIGVIREGSEYRAYLLDTVEEGHRPGELKGVFEARADGWRGTYYSYAFAPRFVEGNVYKRRAVLVWTGGIYWERRQSAAHRKLDRPVAQPTIQALDEETTLFTIPSFLVDGQAFIDLILENIEAFKSSRYLIFDIRGNTGGNALYFAFLDAIADRGLDGGQGRVLASEETRRYFERAAERSPEVYGPVAERIANNPGRIVDGPAYPARTFEDFPSAIERVAILTDGGTMSASESFILHAKEASTKVETFGEPTGGVIDYTSVHTVALECPDRNVYLGYPTSTLHKDIPDRGHNATGLLPDVPISREIDDPIASIREYWKD